MLANLFSPTQLTIVLIILFLLFGAKKLPDLARGLGKSLGEFKKAKKEFEDELSGLSKDDVSKPAEAPRKIEAAEAEKKEDSSDSGKAA